MNLSIRQAPLFYVCMEITAFSPYEFIQMRRQKEISPAHREISMDHNL